MLFCWHPNKPANTDIELMLLWGVLSLLVGGLWCWQYFGRTCTLVALVRALGQFSTWLWLMMMNAGSTLIPSVILGQGSKQEHERLRCKKQPICANSTSRHCDPQKLKIHSFCLPTVESVCLKWPECGRAWSWNWTQLFTKATASAMMELLDR